jgi:ATPase subunit of ABC transporter with duplicated ATPase domains
MSVLLSCSALRKTAGARVLFDNLSLSLSDGDRFGLIGPNGSGKTTLLEILAGRERLRTLSGLAMFEQGATGAAKETLPAFSHRDRSRKMMNRTGAGFAETSFARGDVSQGRESHPH